MTFIIASNNQKKLKELKRIFEPLGISALTAKEKGISLDDVEETGTTFEENAFLKAAAACKKTGMGAIADDSGLCVDALNGAPGIYSARYAGEQATDRDLVQKLLTELKDVPEAQRAACFVSSICCVFPNGDTITVTGKCHGTIGFVPMGQGGFGYDPVFLYNGKSFAQMNAEEKDLVSHRGQALNMLKEKLQKYLEEHK